MALTPRKVTFPPALEVNLQTDTSALLQQSRLPDAWSGRSAWTVWDNQFGSAQRLLAVWLAWLDDLQRPTMLHYVGHITPEAYAHYFSSAALNRRDGQASFSGLAELQSVLVDRGPGIHRILLQQGQISLTLCIGDSHALLSDHRLFADTVWFDAGTTRWDKWTAKALARICARGATLIAQLPAAPNEEWLREAGFINITCDTSRNSLSACFNPTWSMGTKEPPKPANPGSTARCCVIGAGLSGASVAHALARRGWDVHVLDQADHAAAGASGLPVGLVVPHISADDSPRSRLSRPGARLMLQHASMQLTQGAQWELSGVHEHRLGDGPDRIHNQAGWIQPADLIRAWLAHPRIRVGYGAAVRRLYRLNDQWHIVGAEDVHLCTADVVVFANAYGARSLLEAQELERHRASTLHLTLGDLQAVHGTASMGDLPPEGAGEHAWIQPHNGSGCFIPRPKDSGFAWLAGSSFEPDEQPSDVSLAAHHLAPMAAQHAHNLQRLSELLPGIGQSLQPQFDNGTVQSWSGTRCVTHDRLPLAGPVDVEGHNGLWMHVGMGARGLTFSALGAEWIAARICHEPWPMESSLARAMDSQRLRKRRAARQVESDST